MPRTEARNTMRQRLVGLAFFLVVFAATVYFLREQGSVPVSPLEGLPRSTGIDAPLPPAPIPSGMREIGTAPALGPAGNAAEGVEAVNEAPKGPGVIVGEIEGPDGPIPVLGVAMQPNAGRVLKAEGGRIEVADVPAGLYTVVVWADDHLAVTHRDVRVYAGRETRLDLRLDRGIRPAGRIIDAFTNAPVADVLIEFEGHLKLRSDAGGRFQAPHVVPYAALDLVTVSHPDYDRVTYYKQATLDPTKLTYAMTRGTGKIHGRILNRLGVETPEMVRIKMYLDAGNGTKELRRERSFKASEPFTFENLHEGFWTVHAELGSFAARRTEVLVEFGGTREVELVYEAGPVLEGRLLARAKVLPLGGIKVEVLDEKAIPIAETRTDAMGFFKVEGLPAGHYRLKVWLGTPWFNTEAFELVKDAPVHLLEVDCDLQRLKS